MTFAVNLAVIMALMISQLAYANTNVRFRPHITHQAQTLGDVLIIDNDTKNWADIALDSHPLAGEWITRDTVLTWLTTKTGCRNWQWQGKTRTRVSMPSQTSGRILQELAKTALNQQLSDNYQYVRITPLSKINNSHYAKNRFKTDIKLSWPVAKRVPVLLYHHQEKIIVWFKVQAYQPVMLAKETIPANKPLVNSMFYQKVINVAGMASAPVTELSQHRYLKTKLSKNAILLSNQLKEIPLVSKDQGIKIRFSHHNISILIDGIAQEDANLNQIIKIKNPHNQQLFNAKITGSQNAEAVI